MRKIAIILAVLISIFPINTFAAINPDVFDYGYFGVTSENTISPILWAEYPYNNHQWETLTIDSDGRYIVRLFDKRGGIIKQNIQENVQQLDLTEFEAHGIQIQLSKTTGSYARLTEATSNNPLAKTVNFLETDDEF